MRMGKGNEKDRRQHAIRDHDRRNLPLQVLVVKETIMPLRIILNSICSLTWIFLCIIPQARAQSIKPVPDGKGSGTLAQAVLRLPVVASLLHTGAHPDDENSSLMAYVSRGLHARTAYLALNRGEGG